MTKSVKFSADNAAQDLAALLKDTKKADDSKLITALKAMCYFPPSLSFLVPEHLLNLSSTNRKVITYSHFLLNAYAGICSEETRLAIREKMRIEIGKEPSFKKVLYLCTLTKYTPPGSEEGLAGKG